MNVIAIIKGSASVLCGIAGFFWGEMDGLLLALIAFISFDYLTGVIAGFVTKKLSSSTGFKGIAKKGMILLIVAVGHLMDSQILGGGASVCRSAVIGFYLANEGLSILENAGKLGVPFPTKLKDALEQLKKK